MDKKEIITEYNKWCVVSGIKIGQNAPTQQILIADWWISKLQFVVEAEWKRCIDLLDKDHTKCPLPQTCIGYGNAQSDLMNNPPLTSKDNNMDKIYTRELILKKFDEEVNDLGGGVSNASHEILKEFIHFTIDETLRARDTEWLGCWENLMDYVRHDENCIRSHASAGEPTEDGGYRQKFSGKWYQSRPVDETPKCDCGLEVVFEHARDRKLIK